MPNNDSNLNKENFKSYNTFTNFNIDDIFSKIENSSQKNIINETFHTSFFENSEFYLKTALIGVTRGAIGLIWEHPLDSIKTQWQTNIHVIKSSKIITYIYKEKGILGFYRGFLPNLIRQSSKNMYRWPLMIYLPKYFKKCNEYFLRNTSFNRCSMRRINTDAICKIQTGISIANIETLFICPLERLKVFFMTHNIKDNKNYSFLKHFYLTNKGNLIKQLFIGLEPSLIRSNISWISFLYLDHESRTFLKNYRKIEQLDFLDIIIASIIVGTGNLALSKKYKIIYINS